MTDKEYGFTLEDIKRIEGIEVIKNNNFPITVWDKEKKQWVVVHMAEIDNKFYVSEEVYLKLLDERSDK